jgi:hypothetical protein
MFNGQNIPFVNSIMYLGVTFNKEITWRLRIEMIETRTFRTVIRIYFLFKSERLKANIKLTLHKVLIRSVTTYARPPGSLRRYPYNEIAAPAKQGSQQHWKFSKAHTGPLIT